MKRQHTVTLGLLLTVALAGFVVCLAHTHAQQPAVARPDSAAARRIIMTIDYGDGVQKTFTALPWSPAMTVLGALQLAAKHPRGIEFRHRGRGQTALLTQIDDLKNQGGEGRNWIYRVNDKMGDRSFAVFAIESGDKVLWRFEKWGERTR